MGEEFLVHVRLGGPQAGEGIGEPESWVDIVDFADGEEGVEICAMIWADSSEPAKS